MIFRPIHSPYILDLKKGIKEPPKRRSVFVFLKRSKKSLFIFIILILCLIISGIIYQSFKKLPQLRQEIITNSLTGLEKLQNGILSLIKSDFESAQIDFIQADQEFQKSIELLRQTDFLIRFAVKVTPLGEGAYSLLGGGRSISRIGLILNQTVLDFNLLVRQAADKILTTPSVVAIKGQESALPPELTNLDFLAANSLFKKSFQEIYSSFLEVKKIFTKSNLKSVAPEYRAKIEQNLPLLQKVEEGLASLPLVLEMVDNILGKSLPRRYLVVLQNNNEIRPTGGFIGTFARFDVDRGRIKAIEMPAGGSYDIDGQLLVKLKSPQPLWLSQPRWYFHDANWFADWPASAQKLIWFYEKSGGPTVDGVIALNVDLIPELLKITGPIEMTAYQKTLGADNFIFEIQKAVEMEYNREENRPKQILVDFTPIFLKKILTSEQKQFQLLEIFGTIIKALDRKQILFYFSDPGVQNFIAKRNWSGQIKETGGDYLYLVQANVNGAKTAGVIEDQIFHQAEIQPDGSVINTVTLIKKHTGRAGELFTGNKTVDYLKIYVSKGSIFLSASGFQAPEEKEFLVPENDLQDDSDLLTIEKEIDWDPASGTRITEEFGKTVFGNWIQVEPGESSHVSIKYRLPFKIFETESFFSRLFQPTSSTYSLLVQQQPGQTKILIESKLILPDKDYSIVWQYPEWLKKQDYLIKYNSVLDSDKYWAVIIKNKK